MFVLNLFLLSVICDQSKLFWWRYYEQDGCKGNYGMDSWYPGYECLDFSAIYKYLNVSDGNIMHQYFCEDSGCSDCEHSLTYELGKCDPDLNVLWTYEPLSKPDNSIYYYEFSPLDKNCTDMKRINLILHSSPDCFQSTYVKPFLYEMSYCTKDSQYVTSYYNDQNCTTEAVKTVPKKDECLVGRKYSELYSCKNLFD